MGGRQRADMRAARRAPPVRVIGRLANPLARLRRRRNEQARGAKGQNSGHNSFHNILLAKATGDSADFLPIETARDQTMAR